MNNILVVGLGYIGLPLALRLAELGHTVYGEDIDADRRRCVEEHLSPWPSEEGIDWRLAETSLKLWAGEWYDTIIFCIPVDNESCKQLLETMRRYDLNEKLIIVESTLPPLGTDKVRAVLPESAEFAYCPERITAGKLWWNLCHMPRVIGGSLLAFELYRDVTFSDLTLTDLRTVELVKLTENAYRYEKIDFANRLALRCQELPDADVWKVVDVLRSRLEIDVLNPGAGIGGYCLEKDTEFLGLQPYTKDYDYYTELADLIVKRMNKNTKVVILGIAYKADVNDTRYSPGELLAEEISFCYPDQVILVDRMTDLPDADVIVIVQPHSIYKAIDWRKIKAHTVIDLCGFFKTAAALPGIGERSWGYVCLGVNG